MSGIAGMKIAGIKQQSRTNKITIKYDKIKYKIATIIRSSSSKGATQRRMGRLDCTACCKVGVTYIVIDKSPGTVSLQHPTTAQQLGAHDVSSSTSASNQCRRLDPEKKK